MGRRDIRWRERKKPKKGARKSAAAVSLLSSPEVEVVPRKKNAREPEE